MCEAASHPLSASNLPPRSSHNLLCGERSSTKYYIVQQQQSVVQYHSTVNVWMQRMKLLTPSMTKCDGVHCENTDGGCQNSNISEVLYSRVASNGAGSAGVDAASRAGCWLLWNSSAWVRPQKSCVRPLGSRKRGNEHPGSRQEEVAMRFTCLVEPKHDRKKPNIARRYQTIFRANMAVQALDYQHARDFRGSGTAAAHQQQAGERSTLILDT